MSMHTPTSRICRQDAIATVFSISSRPLAAEITADGYRSMWMGKYHELGSERHLQVSSISRIRMWDGRRGRSAQIWG